MRRIHLYKLITIVITLCLQFACGRGNTAEIQQPTVSAEQIAAARSEAEQLFTQRQDLSKLRRAVDLLGQVRDPNQHVIRFGHGIPAREPKLPVERVTIEARIEKRLAALLGDLAKHKEMTLGETLEETLLHTFEPVDHGGVASPHTAGTLAVIQALKAKHGIDYDVHANYRFVENAP